MKRLRFMNATFIILLFAIMTLQKFAPLTRPFETPLAEFNAGVSRDRAHSGHFDAPYLSQLAGFFIRLADSLAKARQRSEILAEWPLENNTAQWNEYYAATSVEKDLIEARFHVENAEVYDWALKNKQKTVLELDKAEHLVQNARPQVKKPALMTIETVTSELEIMKTDATGGGASRPANYETVKKDLDRVIDWVHTAGL